MAFIKLFPESSQFTHDLNKVTLSLRILELHPISLLIFLYELLLKHLVLLKSLGQLDLIFLNDSPTNLLMHSLPRRAQILIDKLHACGLFCERLGGRAMTWTDSKAVTIIQHVQVLAIHVCHVLLIDVEVAHVGEQLLTL